VVILWEEGEGGGFVIALSLPLSHQPLAQCGSSLEVLFMSVGLYPELSVGPSHQDLSPFPCYVLVVFLGIALLP